MTNYIAKVLYKLIVGHKSSKNYLEYYCSTHPWAAECRIYDV